MPNVLCRAFAHPAIVAAGSLDEALARAERGSGFDLVVLDLGLPGCSGIEALTRVRKRFPWTKIAVFSANEDPRTIAAALDAGAAGYITKTSKADVVIAALKLVAAGGVYVPVQALQRIDAACAPDGDPSSSIRFEFSARQIEVLRLLLQGCSNRQIALELGLAESTVKYHVHSICSALGASSRGEAIVVALRRNFLPD